MMGKQQAEPVFVNLQRGMVSVYDANRRPVRVAPWANRNRGQEGVFEVTGEHYRQFVSAKGPLFPRTAGAESAAPAPIAGPAAGDKGGAGDKAPAADAGGKKEKNAPPADLNGYTVEGAIEVIAAAVEPTVLKAWAEADVRKGVKEAIDKRLEELG